MTEADKPAAIEAGASAGRLLRQARQAQGMHIAALAASIKVTPRKLELLEADRYDELLDATFTRALAQTVCRSLKIDPAPVLALLPSAGGYRIEHLGEGINAPFQQRSAQGEPIGTSIFGRPSFWACALVVLAAGVVYFVPAGLVAKAQRLLGMPAATPDTIEAPVPAVAASAVSSAVLLPSAPAAPVAAASAPPTVVDAVETTRTAVIEPAPAPLPTGTLQLRVTQASWIGVVDAAGKSLIGRNVEAGETVGLDGRPPFKVRIGNAGATQLVFRGRAIELAPHVRDNVARLELK